MFYDFYRKSYTKKPKDNRNGIKNSNTNVNNNNNNDIMIKGKLKV